MQIKKIHIICLDKPYPVNYGGAIDMYFKIKALHKANVSIILHVFVDDVNEHVAQLESLASEVYYYKRNKSISNHLSFIPYNVKSRTDRNLIVDLLKDDYPILFEGLHTCSILNDKRLKNRFKMVRMHNIEHHYYKFLADYPNPFWKKLYYNLEALKLQYFESVLRNSNRILAISESDTKYLKEKYPENDVRLLNCFFDDSDIMPPSSSEKKYVLYHGNLTVAENVKVVEYILTEILPSVSDNITFIIAGRKPSLGLKEQISQHRNVELFENPSDDEMTELLANASINILLTFQPTGIKLKLLNSLYKSRGHCIANTQMLEGNDLGNVCIKADSKEDIIKAILDNIDVPLTTKDLLNRRQYIKSIGYNDVSNIIEL